MSYNRTIGSKLCENSYKILSEKIGNDSIAIIPAAHEVTRSYDTEFKFHQDPDFNYLTGFPEPDAVAVINPAGKKIKYHAFCSSERSFDGNVVRSAARR